MERRNNSQPVVMQDKKIRGYAAVFFNPADRGTEYELKGKGGWKASERIMPGAFDQALRSDDTVALWNHNPDFVLGRLSAGTLELRADARGLAYAITPADRQIDRDLQISLERKDVIGSSFGFVVTDESWRKESGLNIREIKGVRLLDISPVTYAAYQSTTADFRYEDYEKFLSTNLHRYYIRARLVQLEENELEGFKRRTW